MRGFLASALLLAVLTIPQPRALASESAAPVPETHAIVAPLEGTRSGLASLSGKITDTSGLLAVKDAHVVLTKIGEEHKRFEMETEADGLFSFKDIEPGEWKLTVSAKDMFSENREVTFVADKGLDMQIHLEDVEPVDVLRVTGKRTLIHPEKIGSTTNIDHKIVQQYKSGNDLRQLVESTPGVMSDTMGNIISRGEHNSVNYVLDDVVLPEAAGVLQQSQFASPRSLQSMQVDIGGYEASDGGGPLGAVARMRSLPIVPKPQFSVGQQIGGPIAGSIYYSGSTAFSQNPDSKLYNLRVQSSGSFVGTSLGLQPPVRYFRRDGRASINTLTKLEYIASERDKFNATLGINHNWTEVPTSKQSYNAAVRQSQHDAQDYLIFNYKHRFARFFDELNLHILNAFYYQDYKSRTVFDPNPVFNLDQPLWSIAPKATRFDYAFGAQGDITKTILRTHHLKAGFLSEVRPVYTNFDAIYYNADRTNPNIPFGAVISPFTGMPGGPNFTNGLGKYKGFRYLQSAYFQDSWRPTEGFWKRLTLDAGVRADVYHGVFGNTLRVAQTLMSIPGAPPFSLQPFETQRVTNAQASGRFGGALVVTPNTVIRGSFSNLFMPPPVDVFSTPPLITQLVNGVFNGTVRPMVATRGKLVDASIEQQVGPRFVLRTNLFYKRLNNFGDSGVVGNSILYNRQQISAQEAYGVETRMDLKPARNGTGLYGFLSNTVQVAYLRGSKQITGGIYNVSPTPILGEFPDHDRRVFTTAALGYQHKSGLWGLGECQLQTGLQDERDPALVGPHPARTPFITLLGFNCGYNVPKSLRAKSRLIPSMWDCRIENVLDQRLPTNLGSPFQGTRFLLPIRVLTGFAWDV